MAIQNRFICGYDAFKGFYKKCQQNSTYIILYLYYTYKTNILLCNFDNLLDKAKTFIKPI